jgi:Effector Associated Constant Component 1
VQVRVRLADSSVDTSRSLRTWLRDEPWVRGFGQPRIADDTGAGEMGTGLEVLSLVLGSGLSAAQLILSIIMWRSTQNRPIRVIIERDDRQLAVDTNDPQDAPALAAKLEES